MVSRRPSWRTLGILGGILLVVVVVSVVAVLIAQRREDIAQKREDDRVARFEEKILAKVPAGAEGCQRLGKGDDVLTTIDESTAVRVECTVKRESVAYLAFAGRSDMDTWYGEAHLCTDSAKFAHGKACVERSSERGDSLYWTDERHDIGGQILDSLTRTVDELGNNLGCCFALTP